MLDVITYLFEFILVIIERMRNNCVFSVYGPYRCELFSRQCPFTPGLSLDLGDLDCLIMASGNCPKHRRRQRLSERM